MSKIILVICIVIFMVFMSDDAFSKSKKLKSVFVKKITTSEIFDQYIFPAKIIATRSSHIYSEFNGQVRNLNLFLGQKVKAGQALFLIKRDAIYSQYKPFEVTAPIDGVISEVIVNPGSNIKAGQKLISIIDPNDQRVTMEVTLSDLSALKVGDKAFFHLLNKKEEVIIKGISPAVNSITATSKVTLVFKSKQVSFPIGSLGQVKLKLNHHLGFLVPKDAVNYKQERPFVRVVDKNSLVVTDRLIKKVRRQGGMVEITKGIKDSEFVVLRASGFLKDGAKVEVKNLPKDSQTQKKI